MPFLGCCGRRGGGDDEEEDGDGPGAGKGRRGAAGAAGKQRARSTEMTCSGSGGSRARSAGRSSSSVSSFSSPSSTAEEDGGLVNVESPLKASAAAPRRAGRAAEEEEEEDTALAAVRAQSDEWSDDDDDDDSDEGEGGRALDRSRRMGSATPRSTADPLDATTMKAIRDAAVLDDKEVAYATNLLAETLLEDSAALRQRPSRQRGSYRRGSLSATLDPSSNIRLEVKDHLGMRESRASAGGRGHSSHASLRLSSASASSAGRRASAGQDQNQQERQQGQQEPLQPSGNRSTHSRAIRSMDRRATAMPAATRSMNYTALLANGGLADATAEEDTRTASQDSLHRRRATTASLPDRLAAALADMRASTAAYGGDEINEVDSPTTASPREAVGDFDSYTMEGMRTSRAQSFDLADTAEVDAGEFGEFAAFRGGLSSARGRDYAVRVVSRRWAERLKEVDSTSVRFQPIGEGADAASEDASITIDSANAHNSAPSALRDGVYGRKRGSAGELSSPERTLGAGTQQQNSQQERATSPFAQSHNASLKRNAAAAVPGSPAGSIVYTSSTANAGAQEAAYVGGGGGGGGSGDYGGAGGAGAGPDAIAARAAAATAAAGSFEGHSQESETAQHMRNATLALKLEWPDWLSDVTYDVVKVNKYGRRQERIICLTRFKLQNAKESKKSGEIKVSREHVYSDLANVQMPNQETILVSFKSRKDDLVYVSPIAAQIAQQISLRVATRLALDNPQERRTDVKFSVTAQAALVRAYTRKSNVESRRAVRMRRRHSMGIAGPEASFSSGVLDEEHPYTAGAMGGRASVETRMPTGAAQGNSANRFSDGAALRSDDPPRGDDRAALGSTREERLRKAICAIVYDAGSPEGRTRHHFIRNFDSKQGTLAIRRFIDGLYDYMQTNRLEELHQVLVEATAAEHHDAALAQAAAAAAAAAGAPVRRNHSGRTRSPQTSRPVSSSPMQSGGAGQRSRPKSAVATTTAQNLLGQQSHRHNSGEPSPFSAARPQSASGTSSGTEGLRTRLSFGSGGARSGTTSRATSRRVSRKDAELITSRQPFHIGSESGSHMDAEPEQSGVQDGDRDAETAEGDEDMAMPLADEVVGETETGAGVGGGSGGGGLKAVTFSAGDLERGKRARSVARNDSEDSTATPRLKPSDLSTTVNAGLSVNANFDQDADTILGFIMFHVIEESVVIPLGDQLIPCLPNYDEQDELVLLAKMQLLRTKPQSTYGIADKLQSDRGWRHAIFELQCIERCHLPTDKLHALLDCSRAIYDEFNDLLADASGKDDEALGADDFLPVFIFVVVNAHLSKPLLLRDTLWALCHPDQLHGEGGYYLTMYEAAVEYVRELEVDEPLPELQRSDTRSTGQGSGFLSKLRKGSQSPKSNGSRFSLGQRVSSGNRR